MKKKDLVILIEIALRENRNAKVCIELNTGQNLYGVILNYEDPSKLGFEDDKIGYRNIFFSQIINIEAVDG